MKKARLEQTLALLIKIDKLLQELEDVDPYGDMIENFADFDEKYPPVTKQLIEMVKEDLKVNSDKQIIENSKTNKKWYPYEKDGSYYRLENGTLLQCPMNIDGTRDTTECEVDWERGVGEEDRQWLKAIEKELEEKE